MSNNLKRKAFSSILPTNFPSLASIKHFADNVSGALRATALRWHIPPKNTVINPSVHYESGDHHVVGGQTWSVLAGPKGKNRKLAFLLAQSEGYQLKKFKKIGVGHLEGDANALVHYVPKIKALTIRQSSGASAKFPKAK